MNRTVLAVIALAVILAIAGYLFYAQAPGTDTPVMDQNVDQMTAPPPAGDAPATPPATTP